MTRPGETTDLSLRCLIAGGVSGLCCGLACGLGALALLGSAAQPGALLALSCAWGALGGGFLGGLSGLFGLARGWPERRTTVLAATAPVMAALALALAAIFQLSN